MEINNNMNLKDKTSAIGNDIPESGNIFTYVAANKDKTFLDKAITMADIFLLALLANFKFENVSGFYDELSLKELGICCSPIEHREDLWPNEDGRGLVEVVSASQRYKDIVISDLKNVFDKAQIIQFAAITFCIRLNNKPKPIYVVAFRDNDDTVTGWSESTNLLVQKTTPSHDLASRYLVKIAEKYSTGDIILTGYGKGGHLASYAGIVADAYIQNRITGIYDFDGYGFAQNIFMETQFMRIQSKIKHFVLSYTGAFFNLYYGDLVIGSNTSSNYCFSAEIDDNGNFASVESNKRLKKIHRKSICYLKATSIKERHGLIRAFESATRKAMASGEDTKQYIVSHKSEIKVKMLFTSDLIFAGLKAKIMMIFS